ncbi:hypothetical protein R1flu_004338 [Riccia fluitans]|uniref:Nucleolus and neural progenitor protein-like N-terminal domain-containing protein n=1 Tax=Riccia fluitans TaxID=41844 RepID=A0ABD1YSY4_9MARC
MEEKQEDVGSTLPLRPPACLAELEYARYGDEREGVLDMLREEAKQVQSRLKEQLKQFRTEVDIFLRLMYKNKNQHRHALYYRRLQQVRRDLKLLDYAALDQNVEDFTRWTFPFKPSRNNVEQRNLEADQVSSTLCVFLSAVRILNQIDKPILAASTQLLGLLTQGFFMSLGVTLFSLLARLRALSQQLLFEFASVYNLLSVFSKEKSYSTNSKTRFNAAFVRANSPRLPLHLECHCDCGRLTIKETKPPREAVKPKAEVARSVPLATPLSSGLWFVDDRKSVGISENVLSSLPGIGAQVQRGDDMFIDTRNQVKYDLPVPAVVRASEEALDTNQGNFLHDAVHEATTVTQISRDEPEGQVCVTHDTSGVARDFGTLSEDAAKESTEMSYNLSFVSSSTDKAAEEKISAEQLVELSADAEDVGTEDRLKPVCISSTFDEPSVVSGTLPPCPNAVENDGGSPGSTSILQNQPTGFREQQDLDVLGIRIEDKHQTRTVVHKDDATALEDVSVVPGDSLRACGDATRRENVGGAPELYADQVGLSNAESLEKGIGTGSTKVQYVDRTGSRNHDFSVKVTRKPVAYISIYPQVERCLRRQADNVQKAEEVQPEVTPPLDKPTEVTTTGVENFSLGSSPFADGQGSYSASHQPAKETPGEMGASPEATLEEQVSVFLDSKSEVATTLDHENQKELPMSASATEKSVSFFDQQPESAVEDKVEKFSEVILEPVSTSLNPTPVSAAVEKVEDGSVLLVCMKTANDIVRHSKTGEGLVCAPLIDVPAAVTSTKPDSEHDATTTLIDRSSSFNLPAAPVSAGTDKVEDGSVPLFCIEAADDKVWSSEVDEGPVCVPLIEGPAAVASKQPDFEHDATATLIEKTEAVSCLAVDREGCENENSTCESPTKEVEGGKLRLGLKRKRATVQNCVSEALVKEVGRKRPVAEKSVAQPLEEKVGSIELGLALNGKIAAFENSVSESLVKKKTKKKRKKRHTAEISISEPQAEKVDRRELELGTNGKRVSVQEKKKLVETSEIGVARNGKELGVSVKRKEKKNVGSNAIGVARNGEELVVFKEKRKKKNMAESNEMGAALNGQELGVLKERKKKKKLKSNEVVEALNVKELGVSKERRSKVKKKKQPRRNGSEGRQLKSKLNSFSKLEDDDPKKKKVNDLFSMLIGGF